MVKSICVIGAGYWGKNHIKTLFRLGCLGGVVELDRDIIDFISKSYDGVKVYQDLEESFKDSLMDMLLQHLQRHILNFPKKLFLLAIVC